MPLRVVLSFCSAVFVACAQTPAPSSTFEVASVKPAAPQGNGRMMIGMRGGPGTNDPGRYTTTNTSLKMLLGNAYDLKDFQISGPSWMDGERFDITAKVPPGTTKEQFRVMLQNLLVERFRMSVHRETKEMPAYTLGIGKNGPKLKEFVPDPNAANDPAGPGRGGPPGPLQRDKDGFPILAAGRPGLIMLLAQERFRLVGIGQAISNLTDFLSRQLERPVVDKTGLMGKYDFRMEFMPEQGMFRGPGPPPLPPGGGAEGPAPASDAPAPTIFAALQELGLKLEPGKVPVDLLVVDKAEKTPIEN